MHAEVQHLANYKAELLKLDVGSLFILSGEAVYEYKDQNLLSLWPLWTHIRPYLGLKFLPESLWRDETWVLLFSWSYRDGTEGSAPPLFQIFGPGSQNTRPLTKMARKKTGPMGNGVARGCLGNSQ